MFGNVISNLNLRYKLNKEVQVFQMKPTKLLCGNQKKSKKGKAHNSHGLEVSTQKCVYFLMSISNFQQTDIIINTDKLVLILARKIKGQE